MKPSPLPVFKLSATGNDFLVIDLTAKKSVNLWKKTWGRKPRAHWVKLWCERHHGLGADGLVFLEADKELDFGWDFYNSDGSRAEMCGNAARAVSFYMRESGQAPAKMSFRTRVGEVEAHVKNAKSIEVTLPAIAEEKWNQPFTWNEAKMPFDFVRAGVPHAVMRVPHLIERQGLRELALALKRLPEFSEQGTNVTFVHEISPSRIASVTFERGVEDFTLSCGTGAVAAAHSLLRGQEKQAVEVQVPGGQLSVIWKAGRPHLKGPAKIVAEIHLCP